MFWSTSACFSRSVVACLHFSTSQDQAVAVLHDLLAAELQQQSPWQVRVSSRLSLLTVQAVESVLFCIRSLAEALEPGEVTHVPAILQLYENVGTLVTSPASFQIPSHPIVTRTLLLSLGALADWFASQEDPPQLLQKVLFLSFLLIILIFEGHSSDSQRNASPRQCRGSCNEGSV
jgi:hypothetical protein